MNTGRRKERSILTVDPGTGGTGLAFWDRDAWFDQKSLSLKKDFRLRPVFNVSIGYAEVEKYMHQIRRFALYFNATDAFIENSSAMAGAKGHMVANSGRLVTLSQYIGRLIQLFRYEGMGAHLVSVQKWKGTLPKDVVKRRILRIWPECSATNHDWDAVGIGMYLTGMINQ